MEKQGKYEEAIQCFNKAIEYSPNNEKYVTSKNSVSEKLKEIQKAFDNNNNRRESDSESDGPTLRLDSKEIKSESKSSEAINKINGDGISRSDSSLQENSSHYIKNDGELDSTLIDKVQQQIHLLKTVEDLTAFEAQLEDILSMIKHKKEILMMRKNEENQQKCVICLDSAPTMICIPCGHLCLCEGLYYHFYTCQLANNIIRL